VAKKRGLQEIGRRFRPSGYMYACVYIMYITYVYTCPFNEFGISDGAAEGKHETVAKHHASHRVELDSVHALQVVLVSLGAHQSLEVAIHREAQQNLLLPGCCRKIKN
jgi:hypothetical protein